MGALPMWRRAVTMANASVPTFEIAQELGTTERSVKTMLSLARSSGMSVAYTGAGGPNAVSACLSPLERAQLDAAALERGLSATALTTYVMRTVINDDLFTAILDP